MEKQPNALIPGVFAVSLLLIVCFVAVAIRVLDSVPNSQNATGSSNRQNAPTSPSENYYNANTLYNSDRSNMSSNSMSSNYNSMDENYKASLNSNNGERLMNSNMRSDLPPAPTFDWRVTQLTELRSEPSESGDSIETLYYGDGLIKNYRKSEGSKWYNVTTESGNNGWIDGNDMEEKSVADR